MRKYLMTSLLLLGACTGTREQMAGTPIITAISSDSVTVYKGTSTDAWSVANKACGTFGLKHAVLMSAPCIDNYCFQQARLFACKPHLEDGKMPCDENPNGCDIPGY